MYCGQCFECQICIKCEKYAGHPGLLPRNQEPTVEPPVFQPPQPPIQPRHEMRVLPPQPPLNEERIREIVLDILIELGLIKSSSLIRELKLNENRPSNTP